jgi:hypothetical protein
MHRDMDVRRLEELLYLGGASGWGRGRWTGGWVSCECEVATTANAVPMNSLLPMLISTLQPDAQASISQAGRTQAP